MFTTLEHRCRSSASKIHVFPCPPQRYGIVIGYKNFAARYKKKKVLGFYQRITKGQTTDLCLDSAEKKQKHQYFQPQQRHRAILRLKTATFWCYKGNILLSHLQICCQKSITVSTHKITFLNTYSPCLPRVMSTYWQSLGWVIVLRI